MNFQIIGFLVASASYFWDVLVDCLVAREILANTFRDGSPVFPAAAAAAAADNATRLTHLFSRFVWRTYPPDFNALHFVLTCLWLVSGCLVQFALTLRKLWLRPDAELAFLPPAWRGLILVSSLFMLGPTSLYAFGIASLLALRSTAASSAAVHARISAFAAYCKMGEIVAESLPQFLTQLLMTSAKGNSGLRQLTTLQMVSVCGSALTIGSGVANFVVDDRRLFHRRRYRLLASKTALLAFVVSELAVCGGVARFSFALTHRIGDSVLPGVALFSLPLLFASTVATLVLALRDRPETESESSSGMARRRVFVVFCVFKVANLLVLWLLFFLDGSFSRGVAKLSSNNSVVTFFATLFFSFPLSFVLGSSLFWWDESRWSRSLYDVSEYLWSAAARVIEERDDGRERERDETSREREVRRKREGDAEKEFLPELDGDRDDDNDDNDLHWRNPGRHFTPPSGLPRLDARQRRTGLAFAVAVVVVVAFVFAVGVTLAPISVAQVGYELKYESCDSDARLPLVAQKREGPWGSICVEGLEPTQVKRIVRVILRQLGAEDRRHCGFAKRPDVALASPPFLRPLCLGDEESLSDCKQFGLGIGLPFECARSAKRLHLVADCLTHEEISFAAVEAPLDRNGAADACAARGGHAATLSTPGKTAEVLSRLRLREDSLYRVGLREGPRRGGWQWEDGSRLGPDDPAWARGEPDRRETEDDDGLIDVDGRLHDEGAQAKYGVVCEIPAPTNPASLDAGDLFLHAGRTRFHGAASSTSNSTSAAGLCRRLGAELFAPSSALEAAVAGDALRQGLERLAEMGYAWETESAWVGMTNDSGVWNWSGGGGGGVEAADWEAGQPDLGRSGVGVTINADGKFEDEDGKARRMTLCLKVAGAKVDEMVGVVGVVGGEEEILINSTNSTI